MFDFGLRLKIARERKGLTQVEAAKLAFISDKALSRYEKNATAPHPDTISRLAQLYDVSCDYLLGLTEAINIKPGVHYDDGLSEDEREIIHLYQAAAPATRAAMLQLLRAAEAAQSAPDGDLAKL